MQIVWGVLGVVAMAIALLLAPLWAAFAAIGFVVGMVTQWVYRWLRAVRRKWLLALNVVALAVIAATVFVVAVPNLLTSRNGQSERIYELQISADVLYDPSGPTWQITDHLEVHEGPGALKARVQQYEQRLQNSEIPSIEMENLAIEQHDRLVAALTQTGWTAKPSLESADGFQRKRVVSARHRWFTPRCKNTIPLASGTEEFPDGCHIYPYGEVRLTVPRHLVGLTTPVTRLRQPARIAGQESIVVPFEVPNLPVSDGRSCITVEVFHPALRNPVASTVRQLAGFPIVNWLLASLCGIFHDRIRRRILWPLVRRTCRALGISWFEKEDDPTIQPADAIVHTVHTGPDGASENPHLQQLIIPRRRSPDSRRAA